MAEKKEEKIGLLLQNKDEILAMASHDLKDLIGVIQLNAHLVKRGLSTENLERAVDRMLLASSRMNALITDLLDHDKMNSGGFQLSLQWTAISQLLKEASQLHADHAHSKSVEIVIEPLSPLLKIHVDPGKVLQILCNLISNAIKFSSPGGTITLHVQRHSHEVEFVVKDQGEGIAETELPFIFERFWQARVKQSLGTGLGLSIARSIVEAHQGDIWAESQLGVGSSFHFTIPFSRVSPVEAIH